MIEDCIIALKTALGTEKVLTDNDLSDRYTHIWRMDAGLNALAIVLPASTTELSECMKICNGLKQKVVVHGGLTNLVGGTKTSSDEIVISLEKMNRITEVDLESRTVTAEAGVILENLHQVVEAKGMMFPLSFGAKGSAQIGGMVSSNAGGLRVLRYGMTRNLVLGLEVVLADGRILSSLKKIIKDNTAYDLKQLFIGSEGTLGIITKAVLKLVEAPRSRCSAFVGFDDYEKVVAFLKFIDQGLAGLLSGYELIWADTYACMTAPESVLQPLPLGYKYYVLIESLGSNQENDQARMEGLLEEALEKEMILDAVPAQTVSDLEYFWKIREDVHVIKSNCTMDHHFDISLPIALIGDYVDETLVKLKAIEGVNQAYTFGHIADGNIHFIVDRATDNTQLINQINDTVYRPLQALGGSVSAEHGIGTDKRAYLKFSRTGEELDIMQTLKNTLDPFGILNHGKIFFDD